jgi:hypothetical protein
VEEANCGTLDFGLRVFCTHQGKAFAHFKEVWRLCAGFVCLSANGQQIITVHFLSLPALIMVARSFPFLVVRCTHTHDLRPTPQAQAHERARSLQTFDRFVMTPDDATPLMKLCVR